jgi:hypothetical protein
MSAQQIPPTSFSNDERDLLQTILVLVVAAGGEIVVEPDVMQTASEWRLVVTETLETGVKAYRAEPIHSD